MFAGGAVAEAAAAAAARGWLRSSGKTPLLRWRGGSSLKEAGASLFRGSAAASRRRPAPGGEEGAAAPELGSCSARTPCLAATPSNSSWRVGMPLASAASDGGPGRPGPGLTARTARRSV